MVTENMQKLPTHFLRFVLVLLALGVLALCIFALPDLYKGGSEEFPVASLSFLLIVIGLYAIVVPFFIALWQSFKLLGYIDLNTPFSDASVKALRIIKYCAGIISILYIGGVPLLLPIAQADDAPGLILIGMAIAGIPVAITAFASLLEKLFVSAKEKIGV